MSETKYDYFVEQTNERLRIIDTKLDSLLAFKWQVFGGALMISAIITIAIQIAFGAN